MLVPGAQDSLTVLVQPNNGDLMVNIKRRNNVDILAKNELVKC